MAVSTLPGTSCVRGSVAAWGHCMCGSLHRHVLVTGRVLYAMSLSPHAGCVATSELLHRDSAVSPSLCRGCVKVSSLWYKGSGCRRLLCRACRHRDSEERE